VAFDDADARPAQSRHARQTFVGWVIANGQLDNNNDGSGGGGGGDGSVTDGQN
jgi:hypothetical protein